ncbi:hypothetical protein [Solimonas variicoloris]|uniref:hypothetical protein n=1 Tax=Solimonas variicoloris TaxID=254408 RepID=UPI000377F8A2|nr:hypothetical protein [Solimonas variicoloris]
MRRLLCAAFISVATLAAACQHVTMSDPKPVPGHVTDLDAFHRFIGTHPTPEQFRKAYPDVTLVLPGQISTREFRTNNSRYFAELGGDGKIVGGKFM